MTESVLCPQSIELLQGMAILLSDISMFSGALAQTQVFEMTAEENRLLRQARAAAQLGAETIETCIATSVAWPLSKSLKELVYEVVRVGEVATQIAKNGQQGRYEIEEFDSLYPALKLAQRTQKILQILAGFDCQTKGERETCPGEPICLIASALDAGLEKTPPPRKGGQFVKILLVDDDPMICKAVVRGLADQPILQLTAAGNAHQALELLESEPFEIIIVDFLMPGRDGCELLRMVQSRWPQLVRILFTASFENHRIQECVSSGIVADIIPKPWDNGHFFASIKKVIPELTIG